MQVWSRNPEKHRSWSSPDGSLSIIDWGKDNGTYCLWDRKWKCGIFTCGSLISMYLFLANHLNVRLNDIILE